MSRDDGRGSTRTITRTITEFPVGEDQEPLKAAVVELLEMMERIHRFGRVTLFYHQGCLVKIEVERSEKE